MLLVCPSQRKWPEHRPRPSVTTMEQGLVWQSLQWRDGTRYEGLTRNGKMHSHGVLTFPNKDRYEGMFEDGEMHGAGVYVWSTGTIYRGDWQQGLMQGCGSRIWKRADGSITAAEGKFWGDEYVGDVMPCGGGDAAEYALDADMAAYQGRSFQLHGRQQGGWQRLRGGPAAGAAASGRGAPAGSSGSAAEEQQQQQQQKLQGVLQRLVADKVQEAQRQARRQGG